MYTLKGMKKKIGLVSVFTGWTQEIANALNIEYTVFNEVIDEWLDKNNLKGNNLVKDLLLPAVNEVDVKTDVVVFDMQTLIHDEIVTIIKNDFDLCWLGTDFDSIGIDVVSGLASGAERALYTEYAHRLSEICEYVCDFRKLGYEGGIGWLKKMMQ